MIYLAHHGIKGQKWGVRKYKNPDGSLTSEGRKRYGLVGSTKAYSINDKRNRVRITGRKVVKSILAKNANRRLIDIDYGTRKSNPWSEKPSNPYDYNWTERPSKRRNGPNI